MSHPALHSLSAIAAQATQVDPSLTKLLARHSDLQAAFASAAQAVHTFLSLR